MSIEYNKSNDMKLKYLILKFMWCGRVGMGVSVMGMT